VRTQSRVCTGLAVALLFSVGTATPTLGDPGGAEQISAVTSAQVAQVASVGSVARAGRSAGPTSDWRRVERVVDGDTLVLVGGEKVRLIGVDTPESVHPTKPVQRFAKKASAFTRELVEGELIRLTYDWERTDRYGRTLAYATLRDGRILNEVLIRRGYARAYTRFRFVHSARYRALERGARAAAAGLWARPGSPKAIGTTSLPASSKATPVITPNGSCYHRAHCRLVRARATVPALELAALRPCRVCRPESR
jgi:micrococcal nuclease